MGSPDRLLSGTTSGRSSPTSPLAFNAIDIFPFFRICRLGCDILPADFGAVWPQDCFIFWLAGLWGRLNRLSQHWFLPFRLQVLTMNQSGLTEPLFTVLLLLICLCWIGSSRPWHFVGLGLLIGLSQWVRLNGFLLLVPPLIFLVWERDVGWKKQGC